MFKSGQKQPSRAFFHVFFIKFHVFFNKILGGDMDYVDDWTPQPVPVVLAQVAEKFTRNFRVNREMRDEIHGI
jgi:hypothetical protein